MLSILSRWHLKFPRLVAVWLADDTGKVDIKGLDVLLGPSYTIIVIISACVGYYLSGYVAGAAVMRLRSLYQSAGLSSSPGTL